MDVQDCWPDLTVPITLVFTKHASWFLISTNSVSDCRRAIIDIVFRNYLNFQNIHPKFFPGWVECFYRRITYNKQTPFLLTVVRPPCTNPRGVRQVSTRCNLLTVQDPRHLLPENSGNETLFVRQSSYGISTDC